MGDAIGKEGGGLISEGVLAVSSMWSFIRSLNISACHRCGLGFPINGSVDRLKTLDSQWRIVLLCQECFARVGSAQACSYCFSCFPELEKGVLDCNMCSRRVHRACVSLHHRNFLHSLLDADTFICVDCYPIPQLRRDLKNSGSSTSRTAFRVSSEDFVEGTTLISEKKATSKGKARENEAKKVMVARGTSELKRKSFDAVHLVKEPSYINLTSPDEKMALQLHQTINGSQRISRSLCLKGVSQLTVPRKEQWSCTSVVGIIDSNSCTHHGKIEGQTEIKSLPEDRGKSESILTNSPLCKQVNGDLMKQVRECNAGYPEDFSLNEAEGSLNFPDSTGDGSNAGLSFLPDHNLETWLKSTMPLMKHGFGYCDGEGSSKLQRKSIDSISPNGFMKKYFRKSWGSERIMRGISHPIFSNSPLCNQENDDLMMHNMVFSTGDSRDFSLQEKGSSLNFPSSTDDGSNANFALIPCHSLNTCLKSTIPVTNYRFGDCDGVGYSKLQRKSIDGIDPGRPMPKYFKKHWDSRRIMQGNSHSILTNSPLLKRKNMVLMKHTRDCNTGYPGDFSLKDKKSSLKFLDSTDDVSIAGSALLPYFSLNTWSNSSMSLIKYRFGDGYGDGSSKLQRMNIDAIAFRSMNKYFRKHWSSKRIMKSNSESILVNSSLFRKENEDLTKQISRCNPGYPGEEKVSSLNFLDSTNDGSNASSALLPCHCLNTWPNSPISLKNYSYCDSDRERPKKLQRKPVDAIVTDYMKKYYRKRLGSKRVMQGTSQSISADSPLFKRENGDLMMQFSGCNSSCPGDFSLKEEISLKCPDATNKGSNIDSAFLEFHGLNNTMPLRKHRIGDGDGEGYSQLQRRSIDAVGSDGSLKKYFRKRFSSRNMQGNNILIPP